ncbi:hypothetical protein ACT7DM_02995 [Bacillus cereus]
MIEKKRIEIFPKHMGFFPYMWFVYLLFPIYHLAQASGWKLVIGSGMLIIFYRHIPSALFCSEDVCFFGRVFKWYSSFLFALFYNPFMIFFWLFHSKCNGICAK